MPARFPRALTAPIIPQSVLPSEPADAAIALSGGFKAALGRKPSGFHDEVRHGTAAGVARSAKAGHGGRDPKAPVGRNTHIGPRSGHK